MKKLSSTAERSLRLVVALFGGYAFAAGFVAVVSAVLPHMGIIKSESAILGGMLGILVYLFILLWMASSTKPLRTTAAIVCVSAIMIVSAPMMVVT